MSDPATIERIFSDNGTVLDEKIVAECASICRMYGITAEDLLWKTQSINFSTSGFRTEFAPVTMDTLSEVKKLLRQNLAKSNSSKARTQSSMTAQVDRSRLPTQKFVAKMSTADIKQEQVAESSLVSLESSSATSNVIFVGVQNDPESKKKRAYRYMYEKISERSESLDQIIDDFADLIRSHYDLKAPFIDPSATTDKEVIIIGRITHDAETASTSKLMEGTIVIESSRMISGARVPLKLDPSIVIKGGVKGVTGFGLFPGCIAAFKGKNGVGSYFLATEYLSIPPLKPSPASYGINNPKPNPLVSQKPASMWVACGPFSADADLGYKSWRSLLHQLKAQKPDVILLVGPFVDSAHPKIKIGDMDIPPSNLFRAHFTEPLKGFLNASPGSIVLLVPSVRDLVSSHASFPQPELSADMILSHPRIHLLPNPARFSVNDISFATTSVDTLFHLRKEEYFKLGVEIDSLDPGPDDLPRDVMAGLCRHILLQRSFYPIFPPPQDLSAEVNLDVTHIDGVRMVNDDGLDFAPDVMILPSRLKQFSKVVHSTTVINPSYVNKGTYGIVSIAASSGDTPKERIKAEVMKIDLQSVAYSLTTTSATLP